MKRISAWGLLLALLFFLPACSGGDPSSMSPEEVAAAFLDEINDADFNGAKDYATRDSESLLSSFASMAEMGGDPEVDAGEFEIKGAEIDGENAEVTYIQNGSEQTLRLKQEEGAWKVMFSKASLMEQGLEEIGDDNIDEPSLLDDEEFEKAMEELDAALDTLKEMAE